MATDVMIKYLKIVGVNETKNRKEVPYVKNARKETVKVEMTVTPS